MPESKAQPRSWAAAQRGGGTVSARAGSVHKMGSVKGQVRANRAKIQGGFTSLQQELGAIDRQLRERTRCARVAGAARHWLSSSASGPLAEAAWEVTGVSRQLLGSCCPIAHSIGYRAARIGRPQCNSARGIAAAKVTRFIKLHTGI